MRADLENPFQKFGDLQWQYEVAGGSGTPQMRAPRERVSAKFIPPRAGRTLWCPEFSLLESILADIAKISEYLIIKHTRDVVRYLLSDPSKCDRLIDVIYKVINLKGDYFGDEAQLVLTVNVDPEITNEYLKFYIRLPIYPDDFMDTIARLRSNYYEDLRKNDIWILVSTDFKRI